MPGHARGKTIELWWQDEARAGPQGTLTTLLAKRGSRPWRHHARLCWPASQWRKAQNTSQHKPAAATAYAPDLNPLENIGQYLRQNYFANRAFEDTNARCCQEEAAQSRY